MDMQPDRTAANWLRLAARRHRKLWLDMCDGRSLNGNISKSEPNWMFQTQLACTLLLTGALAVLGTGLAQGQWPIPGTQQQVTPDPSVVAAMQTLIRDLAQAITARRVELTCKALPLRECIRQNLLEPPRTGRLLSAGELLRLREQLGSTSSYITYAETACPFVVGDAIELARPTGRSLLVFSRLACRQMLYGRVDGSTFSVNRLDLSIDVDH
jgi:hypothetical protein